MGRGGGIICHYFSAHSSIFNYSTLHLSLAGNLGCLTSSRKCSPVVIRNEMGIIFTIVIRNEMGIIFTIVIRNEMGLIFTIVIRNEMGIIFTIVIRNEMGLVFTIVIRNEMEIIFTIVIRNEMGLIFTIVIRNEMGLIFNIVIRNEMGIISQFSIVSRGFFSCSQLSIPNCLGIFDVRNQKHTGPTCLSSESPEGLGIQSGIRPPDEKTKYGDKPAFVGEDLQTDTQLT